ncbi:MAG: alpha/beta fold hydrolase [Nocardioidaceae bacterium]|nr:alpha/beta fold hydrolase [Nocardioidaceae bacterium]
MPAIDQAVASLTRFDPSDSPQAAVLLLHGGAPQSDLPVGRWSASWRVMRWLQQGFEGAIRRRGLATSVWLLRYRFRGWNDGGSVVDSRWALESLRDELGEIPVSLVGHSMGGRTAIGAADHPSVTGVVALAPWIAPETSAAPLAGRRLVAAHGRADKITSFAATQAFVERARPVAGEARFVDMGDVGHYLIAGHRRWWDLTIDEALSMAQPPG